MARIEVILLFALVSTVASFDFENDDFFDDMAENESDKRGKISTKSDVDDTVFISQSTSRLEDGTESIIKESVRWVKNPKTGKFSKIRTTRHFNRLANGTVLEVEDNGSGEVREGSGEMKGEGKVTKIDCINGDDCKEGQFCDELSYACKNCLKLNQTCTKHRQCCEGSMCRNGKCEEITGQEGDPCDKDKDCKPNHCCAYDNGKEVCKPYLKDGDVCGEHTFSGFPSFFASRFLEGGKKTNCPCLKGLQCKGQSSYFFYKKQRCTKKKAKKSKKQNKNKKLHAKNKEERHKKEDMDEDRSKVNLLPDEMMMIDNPDDYDDTTENRKSDMNDAIRDANDYDDNEEEENFAKRSLDNEAFTDDGIESNNMLENIPRFIKGLLKGLFDQFD